MKEIEERLNEEKERIGSMAAPADFEARLRSALDANSSRKPKRTVPYFKIAAVAVLCFLMIGYHYNAVAFYGKKIFGFDEVINGTLKDLNENGMGQIVSEKRTLADGTEMTIDGIMTDANQLILYYTLANPLGVDEDSSNVFFPNRITGFLTSANVEGGVAQMNDAGTELKGTMHFEPVNPFAKKLTLHFLQGNENREESITFPYNPNKALQTQIKQSIKKTIKVDKGTLTFKTITATPTSTFIDGTMDVSYFDRIQLGMGGIELIANGKVVGKLGNSVGTSLTGTKFDLRFDALPEQLDSLELVVKEFIGYKPLEEKIPLTSREEIHVDLEGHDLWIKGVSATERGIEITFATEATLLLDGVSIESKSKVTPIKTTINQIEKKQEDGRILNERIMVFETKSMPEHLLIEGIHYVKQYNKKIEIPVR
jgi:hypothetical protein